MSEAEAMFYFSIQNTIFTSINRDSTNYYVAFVDMIPTII